jgi:hypothetical protein
MMSSNKFPKKQFKQTFQLLDCQRPVGVCRTPAEPECAAAAAANSNPNNAPEIPTSGMLSLLKAALLQWYCESGNNASDAARKNLPIGVNCHTLTLKKIQKIIKI